MAFLPAKMLGIGTCNDCGPSTDGYFLLVDRWWYSEFECDLCGEISTVEPD